MLILKSASSRRKEILRLLGLEFQISPSKVDESWDGMEPFLKYLERVTKSKLEDLNTKNTLISADTIVVLDTKIFPKPQDFQEACAFLRELNGKTHQVYSGLCLFYRGQIFYEYDQTEVKMKNWSEEEIQIYVEKNNPLDKAGAYGIQDENGPVESFLGSFSNVVGFPLRKFFLHYEKWEKFIQTKLEYQK
jgi:septum formation protein